MHGGIFRDLPVRVSTSEEWSRGHYRRSA